MNVSSSGQLTTSQNINLSVRTYIEVDVTINLYNSQNEKIKTLFSAVFSKPTNFDFEVPEGVQTIHAKIFETIGIFKAPFNEKISLEVKDKFRVTQQDFALGTFNKGSLHEPPKWY